MSVELIKVISQSLEITFSFFSKLRFPHVPRLDITQIIYLIAEDITSLEIKLKSPLIKLNVPEPLVIGILISKKSMPGTLGARGSPIAIM